MALACVALSTACIAAGRTDPAPQESRPAPESPAEAPVVIHDRQRLGAIESRGEQLLQEGKAVPCRELAGQLSRAGGPHDLALPAPRTGGPPNQPLPPHEVYARGAKGVLVFGTLYKCDRCTRTHCNAASGFVITESGVAVTNYHVVNQPDRITAVAMTLSGDIYPVLKVLAASEADDLAVVQLDGSGFTPLPVAREAAPVGSDVSVISHPDNRLYTLSRGIVSRYGVSRRGGRDGTSMQITADYARGSSGAPVLNDRGEVVGVVCSTSGVYYNNENGRHDNLQMVFKDTIPAERLLALIGAGRPAEANAADSSPPPVQAAP